MDRRDFLLHSGLSVSALAGGLAAKGDETETSSDAPVQRVVKNGRVRQSVMGWCFQPMSPVKLAQHGKALGLVAIEGIGSEHYPAVRQAGLEISLVSSHGFQQGPLDRDHHAMVEAKLIEAIELAHAVGAPNVITFTGMVKTGISDEQAKRNCVELWKRVMPLAEAKQVTLVLEHLNTKDDSHPMKGHPGYWGDQLDLCADLIRSVDSPRFQLLFDIYHVQIMHGDLVRNIQRYQNIVGHYHTAGNPGRGELDETQEINYPAVIRSILETGYEGYIAQEFIPTWNDPIHALAQAIKVCDV